MKKISMSEAAARQLAQFRKVLAAKEAAQVFERHESNHQRLNELEGMAREDYSVD